MTYDAAKVDAIKQVLDLMDKVGVTSMEVYAWCEALDAIDASQQSEDGETPVEIVEGNRDAEHDDPSYGDFIFDEALAALKAMGHE